MLPAELMDSVPHVNFWFFNLAIPNLIVAGVLSATVALSAWMRLPRAFEPAQRRDEDKIQ